MKISGRSLKLWSILGVLAITAFITRAAFSQDTTANVEVVAIDSDNSVILRATGLEPGEQYAIVISDVTEDEPATVDETGLGEVAATQAWQLGTFTHAEVEDADALGENVVVHRVSIPEQLADEEMLRIGYVLMGEQEQEAEQTAEQTEEATVQATEGATQTEEATAQATEAATQTVEATAQATEAATQTPAVTQTEEATEEGGDQGAQTGGQISVDYAAWALFNTTDQRMTLVKIDEEPVAFEGIPATGGAGQAQETPGATQEATSEATSEATPGATPGATATEEAGDDEGEDTGEDEEGEDEEETAEEGLPQTGLPEAIVERQNRQFVSQDELENRQFGNIDFTMNRNYRAYDNAEEQGQNQCGDEWIVARGEWLGLIVINCDVPLEALLEANPQIQNESLVFPGEVIRIPSGEFEVGEIFNPNNGNAFAAPTFVDISVAADDAE